MTVTYTDGDITFVDGDITFVPGNTQTITPSALALELTLQTDVNIHSNQLIQPATFTLSLNVRKPFAGSLFPTTLTVSPKIPGFVDVYNDYNVLIGKYESGRPFANQQFTFDGKNIRYNMQHVPTADKLIIEEYYRTNKATEFFWYNEQNETTYVVVFTSRPRCMLDGEKDRWKMEFTLSVIV